MNSTQDVQPDSEDGDIRRGGQRWQPRSGRYTYLRAAAVTNLNDLVYPQLRKGFIDVNHSPPRYAHNSQRIEQDLYRKLHLPKGIINQPSEAERL